ncbi:MAG: GNAT family N-acetyltransferase [Acidimicrobiales bacterium]
MGAATIQADGDWYYGTDITVLPEYRGYGIGRHLYELRKDVARTFNRKGIIAGELTVTPSIET